ncbi:piggyBac transposable element-derived protein 4 [Biomphalaria glabrata]|nr:piggyBac transposable element-derived protein 4 [Biomphalaria glabrata]
MDLGESSGLSRPETNSRSRRITAQQALEMFNNFSSDESDNAYSSDSDYENQNGIRPRSSESSDDEEETAGATPTSLLSCFPVVGSKSKKRKLNDNHNVVINRSISDWIMVGDGFETKNQFSFAPKNEPGINENYLSQSSSVLDCFSSLFTCTIMDIVIEYINAYALKKVKQNTPLRRRSRFQNWKPVTKYEMIKFLATTMAMGLNKKPSIQDYFSTDDIFFTPFFSEMFERDRFLSLFCSMLHCGEPDAEGKRKIEPFINLLIDNYNTVYTPFQNVAIDEMIVGFKGRWLYKQFNPSKPYKYHIKSFGLVDSCTGYVLNLLTYYGKNTSFDPNSDKDGGQAVQIFRTLLGVIGRGYHVFADRFYTTRKLVDYLLSEEQYYTGTVQTTRKGFPDEIKKLTMRHKESRYWATAEEKLLVVSWQDKKAKKPVAIVSTMAKAENREIKNKVKPAVVDTYNKYMYGCDLVDQKIGYYGLQNRKSIKWWKKLFHWIVEITISNAHVLYLMCKNGEKKEMLSLKKFKIQLVHALCMEAAAVMPPEEKDRRKPVVGRPMKNPIPRLDAGRHIIDYSDKENRCKVCSTPKKTSAHSFHL